ncbi:hypothetical protein [Dongia sp.]|uniref:hypothetical protein n=1 Tax=Dongia sp. TaxID=1977262 RepID=UPI0035B26492
MGKGSGNNFTFASSAAQSEWRRRAYAQAVHPDNWHLGDAADSESARAIMAGITGPTAPLYRGPDGRHYFANPKTIEPEAWRQIRRQHFKDRTVADLSLEFDRTGRMPGEAEALLALDSAAEGIVPENTSSSPSIRPDTATLSPHGRAILAGMEHAGQTDPHVVAKMTQATDPAATDTRPDVNPIPVDERNPASASLTQASPRAVGRIQETKKKQPVAPIDAERRAELLVFEPVGKGASSFGHVAISFGDLVFSWSPEGLHLARKADYLAANGFRDGKGYPLRLTETEAKELEAHILRFANTASYNPIFANCVDPIELGLEHLGYDVGLTVLPAQLQDALFASGLASEDRSSQYLADSKRKAPDPAMPWSSWSGPR